MFTKGVRALRPNVARMGPTISLAAHRRDQKRRKQAVTDLKLALQSVCDRVPLERDLELTEFARLVCAYACELYDSRVAGYVERPSVDPDVLFGDSGILNLGLTLKEVWQQLNNLRVLKVVRPRHWPDPQGIYRDEDSPELRRVMRRLLVEKYVTFAYLASEPWLREEIRNCVARRVRETREIYEQRLVTLRREAPAMITFESAAAASSTDVAMPYKTMTTEDPARPRAKPGADASTRRRRRGIINEYRRGHQIETMEQFARHVGVSLTAIQGMVRGDRTRYGETKLEVFLKAIGVLPSDW